MVRMPHKQISTLVLVMFLLTNIFLVQPVAWAEDGSNLATEELAEGIYRIPLTISQTYANFVSSYNIDCATGKLLVDADGNKTLQFDVTLQDDYFKPDGTWKGGSHCLSALKRIKAEDDTEILQDCLPKEYTADGAYNIAPSAELQKKYGYAVVDMLQKNQQHQSCKKRVWTVETTVKDMNTPLYFQYEYRSRSSKKLISDEKYNCIFSLTLGEPTTEPVKTTFEIEGQLDKYFQHAAFDSTTGTASLRFTCANQTCSRDDSTKYYYSFESGEAITETSPYIDATDIVGNTKPKPRLTFMNSLALTLGDTNVSNGYAAVEKVSQAVVDIKDRVSADGGTVRVWIKAYREDTGWSDAQELALQFMPLGVNKLREAHGLFLLSAGKRLIPYNMQVTAERDSAYSFSSINEKLKTLGRSTTGKNLLVYNVETMENGTKKVAILDTKDKNWGSDGSVYIENWVLPTEFTLGYLNLYRIDMEGHIENLDNNGISNNYGGSSLSIPMTENMDYLDGQYVFVKKELPDLKDASKYEQKIVLEPGAAYQIPVEWTDPKDYSVIASKDAYLTNRDVMQKSLATVQVKADGQKTAYLRLQPVNGTYVETVQYIENNTLKNANVLEAYDVDGNVYPKLVAIPISEDGYQSLLVDYQAVNLSVYWAESVETSNSLSVAAPKISTTTGATNFVNDATATVTMHTDTVDGQIYYTTDGTTPTTESTKYDGKVAVPAITNGQPTVIQAIAVKEGMNASAVAQQTIHFSTEWWDNLCEGDEYEVPTKCSQEKLIR